MLDGTAKPPKEEYEGEVEKYRDRLGHHWQGSDTLE